MRYWFLKLKVNHGEAEYVSITIHKTNHQLEFDPEKYMLSLSPDEVEAGGSYYFDNGNVVCDINNCQEMIKEEYDTFQRYGV